ncbi:MAG TPA: type II toxin-antitoxin system HicB family antitoxin [Candidatus Sulfopaludibacter sp.]|nr:type II toxin-antitoxin system HicB family antitoxin [Candidatus Sulfopaludibacter sp.]
MGTAVAKLPVLLYPGEDGWIVAACPLLPGCVSQGSDRTEALLNIREAIALGLENRMNEGWRLPPEYELCEVAVTD